MPLLNTSLPSKILPSKSVTVPVTADGDTIAVNVTACPETDGFTLDVIVVVVLRVHRQSGSPGLTMKGR
jgi:endonuclease YncB( thermonuclease family)